MEDEIILKACDVCGKSFTPKKENHFRCSATCRMIYERQYAWKRMEAIKAKKIKTSITKLCSYCGEEFLATSETRRTCSSKCSKKYSEILSQRQDRSLSRGNSLESIRQHWPLSDREPIQVDNFNWPPNKDDLQRSVKQFIERGGTIQKYDPQPERDLRETNCLIDDHVKEDLQPTLDQIGEIL